MQIISLNIWGGKLKEPLMNFFRERSGSIDIFCLQEVFDGTKIWSAHEKESMNIFSEIQAALPNHRGYFTASEKNKEGLVNFVKKEITIKETGATFVFRWKDAMENNDSKTLGRKIEYVSFTLNGKQYLVGSIHGLWNGGGKLDSEDRLQQSRKIVDFLKSRSEPYKILVGDFNLLPDTESIKMIEKNMRNLIKENSITSTRSSFYTKPERFADYCFVSPELSVKHFEVIQDEVSDHLPLLLEI
jgi:endonuclease/exonuclease/phosphatase family metal-dependent hydrolase